MVKKHCFGRGLLVVLFMSVVLTASCANDKTEAQPNQSNLTEGEFKSLLTVQDVQQELVSQVELTTQFYNYKEMAESEDPQQVVAVYCFYGLSFQAVDGMKSLTLAVIVFNSTSSAEQYFQKVKNEPEWDSMQESVGDESFKKQINSEGIGSIIIFLKGDKVVLLHTAMPSGESPIIDLCGLEELANKVDSNL